MSEKFTKGTWKPRENGGIMQAIEANGDWLVYQCGRDRMPAEELEANARLMAQSKNLYRDLKKAAAQLRRYEALHRAKGTEESLLKAKINAELASRFEATLAKARGEV